jgi:hypothetical protein
VVRVAELKSSLPGLAAEDVKALNVKLVGEARGRVGCVLVAGDKLFDILEKISFYYNLVLSK